MTKKIPIIKRRRARKDDSSLHNFVEQVRHRRESLGLPPPEQDVFDADAALAEWRQEQAALETAVAQETVKDKIRRGVKVDSSLHELYWETRREREALGLPPPEHDISDPEKVFAEWRREQAVVNSSARKAVSSRKDKRHPREFAILIAPSREHGYWAYCPAVNGKRWHGETMAEAEKKLAAYLESHLDKLAAHGKPLPKTNGRVKKIKIAAAR